MESATLKKDKYIAMRNKLDELNIFYTFDISNYTLVESLLNKISDIKNDNIIKTAGFEKINSEYEKNLIYVKSLANENDRLVLSNNELHKKIMSIKNSNSRSNEAKELEISKLNNEKNELKILNKGYSHKIFTLETELDLIRKKLNSILNRIFENNIGESSLRKMFEKDIKLTPLVDSNNTNTVRIHKHEKYEVMKFPEEQKLLVNKGNIKMNFSIIDSVIQNTTNNKNEDSNKAKNNDIITHINETFNNNKENKEQLLSRLKDAFEEEMTILKNSNDLLRNEIDILYKKLNDNNSIQFKCSQCISLGSLNSNNNIHSNSMSINNINNSYLNTNQSLQISNQLNRNNNISNNNNSPDTQKDNIFNNNNAYQNNKNNSNFTQISSNYTNDKSYQQVKNVLFNDQKSEMIINYLKKEKETLELKHKIQLDYLMEENKELKIKLNKAIKTSIYAKNPDKIFKQESESKIKQLNEQLQQEIKVLKQTIIQQNELITKLENKIEDFKINYISKEDLLLNEIKFKEIDSELKDSHELIKILEEKLKLTHSCSNSEKTILNNNTIDLKIEITKLNKNIEMQNGKIDFLRKENEEICNKYNHQVSLNMRQEGVIEELKERIENMK